MNEYVKKAIQGPLDSVGLQLVRWPRYATDDLFDPLPALVRLLLQGEQDFFFVQVGANDGERADDLRPLVLRYHLRGLLIEPLPDMYERLQANYASEPQLEFANAAATREDGPVSLFRYSSDAPVGDSAHGMASFDESKIRRLAKDWGLDDRFVEEVRVRGATLRSLLDEHGVEAVSLLMVDTEGFDLEVIRMALECGLRPTLVKYEFAWLSLEDRKESCRLLAAHGYQFWHGPCDTLAVRVGDLDLG